tara:strand:+ start:84 stop:419 length:336 start_codon:yes stop_codon:yes gene_type:complete
MPGAKYSPKQMKIARVAEPRNQITGEDFKMMKKMMGGGMTMKKMMGGGMTMKDKKKMMGYMYGGKVKKMMGGGMAMKDKKKMMGGGKVMKYSMGGKIDGIALRGKTRGRNR